MNMEKFTNKSREALMESQNRAVQGNNNELRAIHLLSALLTQKEGLVSSIISKLGVNGVHTLLCTPFCIIVLTLDSYSILRCYILQTKNYTKNKLFFKSHQKHRHFNFCIVFK